MRLRTVSAALFPILRRGCRTVVSVRDSGMRRSGCRQRAVVYLRPYLPSPERTTQEYPLYLTTGRVLEQFHTGTLTDRIKELHAATGEAKFEFNSQDALKLGIQDGDRVEVKSKYGAMVGQARLSLVPRLGVIFASFYDSKLLINQVVADNVDPTSKEPEFKVTAVIVRKVAA